MTALAVASCGTQRKTVNGNKVVDTQKVAPEISIKSQTPAEFVSNDKAEGRLASWYLHTAQEQHCQCWRMVLQARLRRNLSMP